MKNINIYSNIFYIIKCNKASMNLIEYLIPNKRKRIHLDSFSFNYITYLYKACATPCSSFDNVSYLHIAFISSTAFPIAIDMFAFSIIETSFSPSPIATVFSTGILRCSAKVYNPFPFEHLDD